MLTHAQPQSSRNTGRLAPYAMVPSQTRHPLCTCEEALRVCLMKEGIGTILTLFLRYWKYSPYALS